MKVVTSSQQCNQIIDLLDQNHVQVQEWVKLEDIINLLMDAKVDQDHEED
jgi:hypothetical protein